MQTGGIYVHKITITKELGAWILELFYARWCCCKQKSIICWL